MSDGYSLSALTKDVYAGFGNMQEIFLLSMLIGGMGELMKQQGGLAFLTHHISRMIDKFARSHSDVQKMRASELGIAGLVALTNVCTANNTVAIIVSGGVAKELAEHNGVTAKRSASLLDIFSCIMQGVLPYGAQALLLGSIFQMSPLSVVSYSYYCFFFC
ncbi:methionine transporter MetT [Vibrio cholerae]|nr:methionine transporter MetT [Vibrio cholerae]